MAFRFRNKNHDTYLDIQGATSQQFLEGQLVKTLAGLITPLAGQTDQPAGLFEGVITDKSLLRPATQGKTSTLGEKVMFSTLLPGDEVEADMTSLVASTTCVANTVPTDKNKVTFPYAGAATDFDSGGTVYLDTQDHQGVVVSGAITGPNIELTFLPPAPRAPIAGDKVSALPFGAGFKPKFDGTNPSLTLSNAVTDKAGGNVLITAVKYALSNGVITCVARMFVKQGI